MSDKDKTQARKFGTFGGVFTPNVLTILGVILFLRTGWVVGQAGLKQALILLCIANSITFLTTLSLSAIATNTKAGGGGAYYLISRSLGLEIGGSIGAPLYLAQAVSVAFYIIGFTESIHGLWPEIDVRVAGTGVLSVLFLIAWMGADLAIKTQYVILSLLGLSLVSFFTGYSPVPNPVDNWTPAYGEGHHFWMVFAIFFPAVTGIMSGVSLSGDLKDGARSIPRGTMWAVLLTFLIYAAQMAWLSWNADRAELIQNNLVMERIARVGPLIFLGLWAGTLSSALASLLAAPRTMQALASDRVLPRWLGRGYGAQKEPRLALLLTFVLAEGCLLVGNLNMIAPLISMFFLTTYGMVNLVAGLERWVYNPSWRPTFKVHWFFSLLGAMGCLFVMLLLNVTATVVATVLCFGIYSLLKRRHYRTAWGDVRSGLWFAVTRLGLLQLSASRAHVKNWRPVLLVLTGSPKTRLPLVQIASGIEARRGLLFLAQILTGDWQKLLRLQAAQQSSMEEFIQENRLSAVAKTVLAGDFEHGVTTLLQVAGVGPLQPNTVLIGWSEDAVKAAAFSRTVRRILELGRNLLIYSEPDQPRSALRPVIDVWWRARENGSLMLTLAHLLQGSNLWRDHTIRVLRIIEEEAGRGKTEEAMHKLIHDSRIEAEVKVLVSQQPPLSLIVETSRSSKICFAGLTVQATSETESLLHRYTELVASLEGHVFLAKSWHDLEL